MLNVAKPKIALSTVALIGLDGAGKTTIAKRLLETSSLPFKYMYMGVNIESSNFALPTSRLAHWYKIRRYKQALRKAGAAVPDHVGLHDLAHRSDRRGKIGGGLRLLKRLSESSYRQVISWFFQWRGHIVLYDRHFLFDGCPPPDDREKHRLTDRIHNWYLRKLYPRPHLAILLDAPADILFQRKQEVPLEYLAVNRHELLKKSCYAKHCVVVDASQPLEHVLTRVQEIIEEYCTE